MLDVLTFLFSHKLDFFVCVIIFAILFDCTVIDSIKAWKNKHEK